MSKELYQKLVDLYAGDELTEELNQELEAAADQDGDLHDDMRTLKQTVETLHEMAGDVEMSEDTYERILMRMRAAGAQVETNAPEPAHWQYQLPMQG